MSGFPERNFEVGQSLHEATARDLGRGPNDEVKQVLEQGWRTHAELEGVFEVARREGFPVIPINFYD